MTDAGKLASELWPDLKAAEVEAMRMDANDYGAALKDLAEAVIEHFDASKITGPLTEKARQAILMLMYENRYRTTPAGYAGVKDAEVNKSLPTQGGGAGDRETVAHHLSLLFYEAVGCQALYKDTTERMDAMKAAIARTTTSLLAALQAAPSEGGEPVAWRYRPWGAPDAAWVYADEDRKWHISTWEVQSLYARPPAPSEEPLVGCVVVPREPTDDMIRAASVCLLSCGWEVDGGDVDFRNAYRAMLAAAPAPDAIRGGEG